MRHAPRLLALAMCVTLLLPPSSALGMLVRGGGATIPQAIVPAPVVDGYEPDDSYAVANGILLGDAPQEHTIHSDTDEDWISFPVSAESIVVIETSEGSPAAGMDTILQLYDSDGTTLLDENDDADAGDIGEFSRITYAADEVKTVYVRVTGYAGEMGSYAIVLTLSPHGPDAYEPDDSYGAAKAITTDGSAQQRTIHNETDQDWISFSAVSGQDYVIETSEGSPAEGMDTILYLYDSDGTTLLAEDDDGAGVGGFSRIAYSSVANETLYARVVGFMGNVGTYAIDVSSTTSTTGRITGTVSYGGNGVENVDVWAYGWDAESGWIVQEASGQTGTDGTYSIEGLEPGTYHVAFENPPYPYLEECWNDKPDRDSGDDVVVTAGVTTSGIDAVLSAYGTISGTVTDGTNPISSVWVDCYTYDEYSGWMIETTDATDENGEYELPGLMPGLSYRVQFKHHAGEYLVEHYNDEPDFDDATNIPVGSGDDITINAVLAPAGRITGTVTNGTAPVANVLVQAYHYDATYGYGAWAAGMYTGGDGTYFLGWLPSGTYRVKFDDGAGPYDVEWWNDVATIDAGTNISVTVGSTVMNVNAVLGSVSSGNTAPVAVADNYETDEDEQLVVVAPGVLSNDDDADDDALTAKDASVPSHGSVTLAPTGGFTYTPAAGWFGVDSFTYRAYDGEAHSNTVSVTITVNEAEDPGDPEDPALPDGAIRTAGDDRYLTSVQASVRGFPAGAATVVIATGANWPDALGGSALAGAVDGPLLLTKPDSLPSQVSSEITRLKATKAYVLGSTSAITRTVENALKAKGLTVIRKGGANRYETAQLVADETIGLLGASYQGHAFVATGMNFPDATGAAPVAAALGRPILLANVKAGSVYVPPKTTRVAILGTTDAVPRAVETYLNGRLGDPNVDRIGGANRYGTAAMVAQIGADNGMRWDGVGLSTGLNFPDALSGGAMLGELNCVMLLTRQDTLSGEARTKLYNNRAAIDTIFIFGGDSAVSSAVERAAKAAAL